MRSYEMMLIFNPELDEAAINEELAKISSVIEKSNGKVTNIDIWGVRKLAYPIKHQENGFYAIVYFNSDTKPLNELDRLNKINDKVLRHLIVKVNESVLSKSTNDSFTEDIESREN